jgi:hypothetical protein
MFAPYVLKGSRSQSGATPSRRRRQGGAKGSSDAPLSRMNADSLLPWELDDLQRLSLAKEELLRARERIRLGCLLASLGDPGDAVLTFACKAGRITLKANGQFEASGSDG